MNLEQALTIVPAPAALVARDTRRADEVTKKIVELDTQTTNAAFDQIDLLHEVEKDAHWATLGFQSAKDYYKSLNIQISPREIDYRVKIAKYMPELGLSRADYVPAGISKLKAITQLSPAGEIVDSVTGISEPLAPIMKRMVLQAPHTKLSEIQEQVDALLGKTGEDELTWLNLPIRRDAKEIVRQALDLAKALSGDTLDAVTGELKDLSDAAALERISADFLADPNNAASDLGEGGDYSDAIAYGDEGAE